MNTVFTTIIKPKNQFSLEYLKEFWDYKGLLYFFTWRDLKVRYKQTAIGVLWAFIQPFIAMVVFTVLFGNLVEIPTHGVPYPIYVFVGLLFWQFFSGAISEASNAMVNNAAILTKVYFPRWILPASNVAAKLVDFFIASLILIGMMVYYQYMPSLTGLLLIPLFVIITFVSAFSISILLSAINVWFRDVRYGLPFIIQMMFFVTPVIYPADIAGQYSWILALNPISGVIDATRVAIFSTGSINWTTLGISIASTVVITIVSLVVFYKSERKFADIV